MDRRISELNIMVGGRNFKINTKKLRQEGIIYGLKTWFNNEIKKQHLYNQNNENKLKFQQQKGSEQNKIWLMIIWRNQSIIEILAI